MLKLEQNNYHDVIIIKKHRPNSLLVLVINVYIVCARCCKTYDIVLWNLALTYDLVRKEMPAIELTLAM